MKQALQHPPQQWQGSLEEPPLTAAAGACRAFPCPVPNFTQQQPWLLCCMQGFTTFSATALALTFVFGDSVKGVFEVSMPNPPLNWVKVSASG